MKHVFKNLGLLFVLMVAQQGAVVHELSHVSRLGSVELQLKSGGAAEALCVACPAFAQVVTPAFSHAFHVPARIRVCAERQAELLFSVADAPVPLSRSRGPPSLS